MTVSNSEDKTPRNMRLFTICGIVAPIIFWVMVIIESLLRPGYSQLYNYVSDLGVGPLSILQNINFIVFGILTLIFSYSLKTFYPSPHTRTMKIGILFFILFSLGVLLAGIFPEDYLSQVPHNLVSSLAFLSIIIAQILIWHGLTNENRSIWGKYRKYTLISGLISIFLIILLNVSMVYGIYPGLVQRDFLIVTWIWILITGLKLYNISDE